MKVLLKKDFNFLDIRYISSFDDSYLMKFNSGVIYKLIGEIISDNYSTGKAYIIMNDSQDVLAVDSDLVEFIK